MVRTPVVAVLAVVLSAVACNDSSPAPSPSDGGGTVAWHAAVGDGGLFAQTFDDAHWGARTVTSRALLSVSCVGNRTGWVSGQGGFVAHTEDGGATWAEQDAKLGRDLHAIRFGTTRLGVVAGDAGALAVTADGGQTWGAVATGTTATLRGAAIASDTGFAIVVGDRGTILRTLDAGKTFTAASLPGGATPDLHAVAVDATAHRLFAVDGAGGIWSSEDRGASFVLDASLPAGLDAVSTSDDGARVLAAGAGGAVYFRQENSGWQRAVLPVIVDLHAVLAAQQPGARTYAAGDQGVLLASDDDGAHFYAVPLGRTDTIRALEDL